MHDERARQYRPLRAWTSRQAVDEAIRQADVEVLRNLPLELGMHWPDWKWAQDTCLRMADIDDAWVRANSCLGLAYVARVHGRLEKHLVKPVLIRELRRGGELQWRVIDAIEDINHLLKWKLAQKFPK